MNNPWKNPKNFEFFWFFAFLQVRLPSKTKKTLIFFSFFKVTTKKTKKLEENQKNQTWASDQTFSEKFWFFGSWVLGGDLESRWRNSHVFVYHGPLLSHLLGVAPSTFTPVYHMNLDYQRSWCHFHTFLVSRPLQLLQLNLPKRPRRFLKIWSWGKD